ncbi:hypothetical protein JCM17960_09040 [Magnetospira thiophila]
MISSPLLILCAVLTAIVLALLWKLRGLSRQATDLQEEARRVRAMVAVASEGFWVIDPKTRVTLDVNDALSAMLGYGKEEMLGRTPLEFTDAANAAIFKSQTAKISDTDHRTYEVTLTRKDGAQLPTMFNATTLRDAANNPVAAFAFVTDLTLIKATEAELREIKETLERRIADRTAWLQKSEERFRNLYELAPLPYQSLDESGQIIEVNEAWLNFLGYRRAEVIGHPILDFLAPEQDHLLKERLPLFLEQGEIHGVEFDFRNRAGAIRTVSIEGQVGYGTDGGVRQTHCILTDVTARRQAERDLRRSEAKYRRLVEEIESEYFLYSHNPEGVTDYVSPSVTQMLGYTQEAFCGPYTKYMTDNPINIQAKAHTRQSLAGVKQPAYEVEIRHNNGSPRMLEVSESPVRNEAGQVISVEGIAHDITQQKEAEAKILRTVEELTQSNIELERFAYVASHDLQEPLRAIVSFSQLLLQKHGDCLDGEAEEYLNFIADGAKRMNTLVQGLLQYSRLSARAEPFGTVRIAEVLEIVRRNLRESLVESGAEIVVGDLPEIRADSLQISMLLQNLISNAIKYRHSERRLIITLSVERLADVWRFTVADNGIGIEERFFTRIFEIFRRLHSPAHYPGTGIGLSLCKRIVERHGGTIWVESEPGVGSSFLFDLPHHPKAASPLPGQPQNG